MRTRRILSPAARRALRRRLFHIPYPRRTRSPYRRRRRRRWARGYRDPYRMRYYNDYTIQPEPPSGGWGGPSYFPAPSLNDWKFKKHVSDNKWNMIKENAKGELNAISNFLGPAYVAAAYGIGDVLRRRIRTSAAGVI